MTESKPTNNIGILIVEDDTLVAADLESRLKKFGYTTFGSVATGKQSLELVERCHPDLVFVDIILEGEMDGIDTADIIREKWEIPVVFLAAYADADRLKRAKLTYPFGYIFKPFKDKDLKITVEMALHVAKNDAERRSNEESLRRMEKQLRTLGDSLPDGLIYRIVNKPDGRGYFDYLSAGFLDLFELSPDVAKQDITPLYELLHPEDRDAALEAQRQCAEHLRPFRYECRFLLPSGITRWIRWHSRPEPTSDGGLVWHGMALDITVRKNAEQAFIKQEKYYRSVLETTRDGFFVINPERKFTDINESYCTMSGYTKEEFLRLSISDIDADEKSEITALRIARIIKNGSETFETRHRRKDGRVFDVEITASAAKETDWQLVCFCRDISTRKQAGKIVIENQAKTRAIFNAISDPVFLHPMLLEGYAFFIEVNDTACKRYGYTREEFLRLRVPDITPEVEVAVYSSRKWRQKMADAGQTIFESTHITKQGELFPVEINAVIFETNGVPMLLSVVRDITDRKRAEEKLRESEKRFRAIYENVQVGIARVSNDYCIESANQAYCRILGYREDELIGRSIKDITHPDGLQENLHKAELLLAGKVDYYQYEKSFIHKSGRIVNAILNASLVRDKEGRPDYTFGSILDITDRKQAEEALAEREARLNGIFSALHETMIILIDRECNHIAVWGDDELAKIYGVKLQDLVGTSIRDLASPEDADEKISEIKEIFHTGIYKRVEYVIHPPNGYFWNDITFSPIFDSSGNVSMVVGFIRDTTERKRTEEALRKALEEKEILLQEIHHRVKNNMQSLSSLLNLQVDREKNKHVKVALQEGINRIEAMALTHEAAYQSENLTEINVDEYISILTDRVLETFSGAKGDPVVNILISGDLSLPIKKAMPFGLVLNEIITNALKYAFPDDEVGEITIKGAMDGDQISLYIRDNGVGLPANFDLDKTKTLGMSLIKLLICGQLRGSVEIKNNIGTEIIIRFPV